MCYLIFYLLIFSHLARPVPSSTTNLPPGDDATIESRSLSCRTKRSPRTWPKAGNAWARSSMSLWVSEVAAAAALDRALSMRLAPGMGSIMGDKAKSQAMQTWEGLIPWRAPTSHNTESSGVNDVIRKSYARWASYHLMAHDHAFYCIPSFCIRSFYHLCNID